LLGIFNLLPIPPLDGARVLIGVLPEKQALWLNRFEPFGFVLLLLLIFFTDIWSRLLSPVISLLIRTLAGSEYHYVEKAISFLFAG
jgi:Zn-dependent protease